MDRCPSYLPDLMRINDALVWAGGDPAPILAALMLLRETSGAELAPLFLLDDTGDGHVLIATEAERAYLGASFTRLPAAIYVRPPWLGPDLLPVSAAEHPEAYECLPESFKDRFGPSEVVVPLPADGRHMGAILLEFAPGSTLDADLRGFLAVAGRMLGHAVQRWQIAVREREIGKLDERRRLGDELHVDLSQRLAALGLQVGLIDADLASNDRPTLITDVHRLSELVADVKSSLRLQMMGLRADRAIADVDFAAYVRSQAAGFSEQFNLPVTVAIEDAGSPGAVPLPVATQLGRVLQESLTNIHSHAQASHVVIRLFRGTTRVRLEIQDDGVGFDPKQASGSRLGLQIMRERMQQVDGSLQIGPRDSTGTLVCAEVPLRLADRLPTAGEGTPWPVR